MSYFRNVENDGAWEKSGTYTFEVWYYDEFIGNDIRELYLALNNGGEQYGGINEPTGYFLFPSDLSVSVTPPATGSWIGNAITEANIDSTVYGGNIEEGQWITFTVTLSSDIPDGTYKLIHIKAYWHEEEQIVELLSSENYSITVGEVIPPSLSPPFAERPIGFGGKDTDAYDACSDAYAIACAACAAAKTAAYNAADTTYTDSIATITDTATTAYHNADVIYAATFADAVAARSVTYTDADNIYVAASVAYTNAYATAAEDYKTTRDVDAYTAACAAADATYDAAGAAYAAAYVDADAVFADAVTAINATYIAARATASGDYVSASAIADTIYADAYAAADATYAEDYAAAEADKGTCDAIAAAAGVAYTHYAWGNTSWPAFQLTLDPEDLALDALDWQPIPTFNIEQLGGGRYVKNIIAINNKGAIFVGAIE